MRHSFVLVCGLAAALLAPVFVGAGPLAAAPAAPAAQAEQAEQAERVAPAAEQAAQAAPAEQAAQAEQAAPENSTASEKPQAESPAPVLGKGLDTFALGMSVEAVRALGAQPTDNPDMLQLPIRWADADWTCMVQFDKGKAAAVLLHGELSDELLERVFADLRGRGDMPVTVQPAMGHPDIYQLSAQGKSDEECWLAMRKRLGVFAHATEGACSVLFTTEAFFRDLAATVKEPAQEESLLAKHTSDAIYAVNMDKSANQITYLVAPWGYMSR